MIERFGSDIGGVITVHGDQMFGDDYLNTSQIEGAFQTIAEIRQQRFKGNAELISKCGSRVQARTLEWLDHTQFYEATGIDRSQVHFTPDRIGKRAIAESLGITHFVDDRLEVLGHLIGVVDNLYLFNGQTAEIEANKDALPYVTRVQTMPELKEVVLK